MGNNSVTNLRKMTCKNTNLDFVQSKAYTEFGEIPSICSKDTEWKPNSDLNQGL